MSAANWKKCVMGAALLVASPSAAAMLAIYSREGATAADMELMRAFAKSAWNEIALEAERVSKDSVSVGIDSAATLATPTLIHREVKDDTIVSRYSYTNASVLTREFSVPPGVVVYFLVKSSLEWTAEFTMRGECMRIDDGSDELREKSTETPLAKSIEEAIPTVPVRAYQTAFLGAIGDEKSLTVRYSLATGAKVSARAYGVNGQTLGNWTWQEPVSGSFQRSFSWGNAPVGPFFLRWESSNQQMIQRMTLNQRK